MKKNGLLTFILLLWNVSIFAQASGNANYSQQEYNSNFRYLNKQSSEVPYLTAYENQIKLRVNALSNVKADSYLAVFNISQVGKTAKETDEILNNRVKKVVENLKNANIAESDIFVDMISLVPKYEWESDKKLFSSNLVEVPVGFELQKNLNVYYKNSKELDKIVTICAEQEIYDLVKVDYFVNDVNEVYANLRELALIEMGKRIKSFEKVGFKLDTLFKIVNEEKSYAYPPDRYKSYSAYRSNAIDYKKSSDKIYRAEKQTSLYYDPVSYKDFDIVVNPVIKEPMVQFSYSLQINFTKEKPKEKLENYFIITPNGDIKSLKLNK